MRSVIVDLTTVTPAELEALWQYEEQWWRECLLWDVSEVYATMRRFVARRNLPGKAVRVGEHTVGYTYYILHGHLGILSGFSLMPAWNTADVGEPLLKATLEALRGHGVRRIESQCVVVDSPWLVTACEREGFSTSWREFLRRHISLLPAPVRAQAAVRLEPWRPAHLYETAPIMHAAYGGGIDAESISLYRTPEGCHTVLEQTLHEAGCGVFMADASAVARVQGQAVGFTVLTEIAPRQGHLAQIAVLPAYQRRGIGQALWRHSLTRLQARQGETLSLIVSRANYQAMRMYRALGLQSVVSFPIFVWEHS